MVRRARATDEPQLWRALGHAATWRGGVMAVEELREVPELCHYVAGWTPEQGGVVAVRDGEVVGALVGAAWFRMLGADDPGYGFVRAGVPELSMGLDPGARGAGLGTRLLNAVLDVARDLGYDAVSLSVERDNVVAHRMYRRAGFEVVASLEAADTMLWRALRGRDRALR